VICKGVGPLVSAGLEYEFVIFFKCAKRRRREKNEEKIRKFAVHQSLLTDISETLCVIFLKFGI